MKRFAKFLIPLLLLTVAFGFAYYEDSFKIIGPPEFKADVEEALALLEEKAPEYHDMVLTYLKTVELVDEGTNGVDYFGNFTFTKEAYENRQHPFKTISISLDLVHEGTHVMRIKEGLDTKIVEDEERIAVEAEKEVAQLIGAPKEALEWLDTILETRWWEQQGK